MARIARVKKTKYDSVSARYPRRADSAPAYNAVLTSITPYYGYYYYYVVIIRRRKLATKPAGLLHITSQPVDA